MCIIVTTIGHCSLIAIGYLIMRNFEVTRSIYMGRRFRVSRKTLSPAY